VGNFNYIDFVTTQKHELSDEFITNLVLEHLVKDYLNNNNIVLEGQLDEGIIDLAQKLKNKLKGSKLADFGKLVKVLKDTRKPKKVMAFITSLKNAGINIGDKKELATAIHYIENPPKDGKINEDLKVSKEYYDAVAKKLGPSIDDQRKFFTQNSLGSIIRNIFLAAVISFNLSNQGADTLNTLGLDVKGVNPTAMITDFEAGFDGDAADYEKVKKQTYGPERSFDVDDSDDQGGGADIDQGDLATDTAEIEDAKSQGLELNPTGNETANATKFDNASSQLDDEGKQKIASENSTIIDYLQQGLDYVEVVFGVSSNTGENANVDDRGGPLGENRANNTADYILDNLESQLNEEGIEYERTGNTIKVEGGGTYTLEVGPTNDPGTLNSINKTNDTATQAAWRVGAVDGVIAKLLQIVGFDPVRKEPAPDAIPINSNNFKEFNRNTQIAIIFSLFNPENNIFQLLGGQEGEAWEITGDLNNGLIGQYRNNPNEKISNLANAIANARKSRKSFVRSIGRSLGVELGPITPGKYRFTSDVETQTQGGKVSAGPRSNIQEIHPFNALLEAAYTSYLPSISDVNKKAEILVYLSTMYITLSDGNEVVGISPNNLDDSLKTALSKYEGFHVVTTGEEKGAWTFLTKDVESRLSNKISDEPAPAGGEETPSGDDIKLTPDVTRVKATMDRQPTLKNLFNRINTKVEYRCRLWCT
jgi:hypothetical protein